MPRRAYLLLEIFGVLLLAFVAAGCSPQIGDKCVLNTDCSISGDRQCDTSMPGGYCTIFNCGPNSCPEGNACYLFHAEVQGCPYDDRTPSRTAHSFCMKDCQRDTDCRLGYRCRDLRGSPWSAILLDDNQSQRSCIPDPDAFHVAHLPEPDAGELPVCQAAPDIDAAFPPPPEAGVLASPDAGADGAIDAGDAEAGAAGDAGLDATIEAGGDGSTDAADAGAPDATLD